MRSALRMSTHAVRPGEPVIEIWYGGKFIGQITTFDGPGVRVISKHAIIASDGSPRAEIRVSGAAANFIDVEFGR